MKKKYGSAKELLLLYRIVQLYDKQTVRQVFSDKSLKELWPKNKKLKKKAKLETIQIMLERTFKKLNRIL